MTDDWDVDFLTVQNHLDALDEPLGVDLQLRQYRRWVDFAMMVEKQAFRFRRADTIQVRNAPAEAIVHDRVRSALSAPEDAQMLRVLGLAKRLYISSFTANTDNARLWADFAPHPEDVCLVTNAEALRNEKPLSVIMLRAEYGVDWGGSNPSDQIFQKRDEFEAICSVEGIEFETDDESSFAEPLKYLLSRFQYQNEVRLVYSPVSLALDGYSIWTLYEADEYGPTNVYVMFDLARVISEVAVRSDAPPGHEDRVRHLLRSIGCVANVRRSNFP